MQTSSDSLAAPAQETSAQHGLALVRDDTMLAMHTLHQRLLQDSLQAQQALLDQYQQELESLSTRWSLDARDKAERTLNAALTAGKDAMAQAMQDASSHAATSMRAEMDAAQERIAAMLQDAQRGARLHLLAACLALAAMAVAAWVLAH
ncbi:conjugal transfer protein TraM [Acidovorax sp. Be4]|uniref:Conjugal transfer protein TraM n=1 Tax=Acidovorax bellezanensis TaxID=2976702 RepID=A0ABT2PKN2_9BURK|nr:conjugal transfer protein TraM [Acidovorax sp. Be4]MCT9811029.1 conjugal transfer protein TraM [Acidovorax sp. Be4]